MKLSINIKKLIKNPLAKATTGTAGLKIAFTASQFLISLMLARILGAGGYGVYVYAIAWLNLLTVFALFGADKLILREVSVYVKQAQWSELSGILCWGALFVLCISAGLGGMAALVAWGSSSDGNHMLVTAVSIAMLALPLTALGRLRQAAMQGLDHVVIGQIPENLIHPVIFMCLIVVLWAMFGSGLMNAVDILKVYIIALSVTFLIGAIQFAKKIPGPVSEVNPIYHFGEWFRSAMPMMLVSGMSIINARIDTILLGAIKGATAAGIYVVAARGAELIVFVLVAVNIAVAPTFAALYAANEMRRLQKVVSNSTRIMLLAAIPVAAGLILFGSWFLWIFGSEFMAGKNALTILSIGQVFNVAMGLSGILLIMSRHTKQAAFGVGVSMALNVVFNLILIPVWGVSGAAIATVISIVASNILLAILVYKKIGINTTVIGLRINMSG